MYPAFNRGVVSSNLTGPAIDLLELIRSITEVYWSSKPKGKSSNLFGSTWMNSSMAERRLVKPMVESSNLSSSAMFVDEYNSVMRRKNISQYHRKQMVLWQNGYAPG